MSRPEPLSNVTAGFFAAFLAEIEREAAADPEPRQRFSAAWGEWQKRHWKREGLKTELRQAEALTTAESDPAPLAREGLAAFLDWSSRQAKRPRRETRRRR